MDPKYEGLALGYGRVSTIARRLFAATIARDELREQIVKWMLLLAAEGAHDVPAMVERLTRAAHNPVQRELLETMDDAEMLKTLSDKRRRWMTKTSISDVLRIARFFAEAPLSEYDAERYEEDLFRTLSNSLPTLLVRSYEDGEEVRAAQTRVARELGVLAGLDAAEIERLMSASDAERIRQHEARLRYESGQSVEDDELMVHAV